MSASTNDKITDARNAARPNSARATGTRAVGGNSLACDNLSGWPTASKVHFVTYQVDANTLPVTGTQLDCSGIVSGNSIGSFTVIDGADTGNQIGDYVEMLPTAGYAQDLADALTNQHSRTGAHVGVNNTGGLTTDTMTATGNATVGGTLGVTGAVTHSGATTLTGAVGGAGYSTATISNPYKFDVYLSAVQNVSSATVTKALLDTKTFDTHSDFDVATNHRFVVPITGYYFISAQLATTVAGTTSGVATEAYVYKNGSEIIRSTTVNGSGSGSSIGRPPMSRLLSLAAGDYLELFGFIGEGGRAFGNGSTLTFMSGFLVSAT